MNDPLQERTLVLETLESARQQLVKNLRAGLVPPEGVSVGYAIRGARDSGGIAVVSGCVPRPDERDDVADRGGAFGEDEDLARIILTAMKFDPRIRAAARIAHSPRVKSVLCDDLFLESASCDRDRTTGTGTMDWGIASCCRRGVPDVIFRRDGDVPGMRTLLFGEDPADVLNNIIMCSNRI